MDRPRGQGPVESPAGPVIRARSKGARATIRHEHRYPTDLGHRVQRQRRRGCRGALKARHIQHTTADRPDLDFTDPSTWATAFRGVESLFLVRPPAIGNVKRDLLPAVAAARDAGVQHVVFLSLQGAEQNKVVPHATVETWLRRSGLRWTFVRASFFHKNLSTTHLADIRDHDQIVVPAGHGATAFVDAEDVGAVAAAALSDPQRHADTAWTVTGPRALTYDEIAQILTKEDWDDPSVTADPACSDTPGMPVTSSRCPGAWSRSPARSIPPRASGWPPGSPTTYAPFSTALQSTSPPSRIENGNRFLRPVAG